MTFPFFGLREVKSECEYGTNKIAANALLTLNNTLSLGYNLKVNPVVNKRNSAS